MIAVELSAVSKKYNIYDQPVDRLKEIVFPTQSFHREFWAVRDVSATFEGGATTALLGPNGSGKSTLLQIIAGIIQPTAGSVRINGRLSAILELGAGFQPDHTGRENVLLNGMILGISRTEMERNVEKIADFAEIGDFFDQPVRTYSSGMIVRLAFACAINVDPEILLVDEALAVGDAKFQLKCFEKLDEMKKQGKTIIFVSHDMGAVGRFCNKAILLNGGSVVTSGNTHTVIEHFKELMESNLVTQKVFSQAAPLR